MSNVNGYTNESKGLSVVDGKSGKGSSSGTLNLSHWDRKASRRPADGTKLDEPTVVPPAVPAKGGIGERSVPSYTGFTRFNANSLVRDRGTGFPQRFNPTVTSTAPANVGEVTDHKVKLISVEKKPVEVVGGGKAAMATVPAASAVKCVVTDTKTSTATVTVAPVPAKKSVAELPNVKVSALMDSSNPPAVPSNTFTLSTKRELFFRQDGSTATINSTAVTNGTASSGGGNTGSGVLTSKEQQQSSALYGKENKQDLMDGETTTAAPRYKEREKDHHIGSGGGGGSNIKDLDGFVGFANLPNQVYRKAVKKGFEFTLMAVGESGLGKSTLINSMFLADIYSAEHPGPSHRIKRTVQVETSKVLLKENGVNLTLTMVDTPGFGDAVDNSNCWQSVIDYIESKYEEYLNCESRVNRRSMPDSRVHCCLYFIAPSGHGLKPLDVEFMKRLHDKVNIIPIIAKADTMTPEECILFKKTIMSEIAQHKIKIYEFPDCDDEEENKTQKPLKDRVPFAVVGSNTVIEINGKKVRGRKYPWGVAEVENMEHCDFIALRNMLIRTHMQDLKDITNSIHYENFRCRKLAGIGSDGKPVRISNKNPLAQMEEEKKEHEAKIKKTEQEMEQVFEMKVREKKQKLKDSEADLQRRHEQMKKNLEQQQKELEEKRRAFEKEKCNWEEMNKQGLEDLRRRSLESNSKETHVDTKEKKKEKKKGLF